MILFPKLKNAVLNELCDQCGTTLDFDEPAVTSKEIEFFAEQIVKECMNIVRNANLEDIEGGDSAVLGAAADRIRQHFGVE